MHPRDHLSPLHPADARCEGSFASRIRNCAVHQLATVDIEELLHPFRTRGEAGHTWQAEFWGKWITGAITAWQAGENPVLADRIARAVDGLLATQAADGSITTHANAALGNNWEVWGRKYVLLGLLAWHQASGDRRAIRAALGVADHLATQLDAFAPGLLRSGLFRGLPATSILEPLCLLHRVTGEARILALAQRITEEWAKPEGPDLLGWAEDPGRRPDRLKPVPAAIWWENWFEWGNGAKAYEMLSCIEGLCELHRETGDPRMLRAALNLSEAIVRDEIAVTGSGSEHECWGGCAHDQQRPLLQFQETCTAVTWAKLCVQLLRLTGDPIWGHRLERTVWNALAGAQRPDGGWWTRHAPLTGERDPRPMTQVDMSQNCCVVNGPRALCAVPSWAVMEGREGPNVVLHLPGRWRVQLPDGTSCRIAITTRLPENGTVLIRLDPGRPVRFRLSLRIPAWASGATVAVGGGGGGGGSNGESTPAAAPSGWWSEERIWSPGDEIRLELPLTARIEAMPGPLAAGGILVGPVLLAADHRLNPNGLPRLPLVIPRKELDRLALRPSLAVAPAGLGWAGSVTVADGTTLGLCDWASAGNTWDAQSRYQTLLAMT